MHKNEIEALALSQLDRYPALTIRDLVKCLYQAKFGCGHLVEESPDGLAYLKSEAETAPEVHESVEPIGAHWRRVHLDLLRKSGLSADTLYRIFVLSAAGERAPMAEFDRDLDILSRLIRDGVLHFDPAEADAFLADYRAKGCPATHHSEPFRASYRPAYRVISAEYALYLPLFARIDALRRRKDRIRIAVDGCAASGKTTLARMLNAVYGGNVFHMDDFFLRKEQRTPERLAEPGGNVDRERFHEEVLVPLIKGIGFSYRVFDCGRMALGGIVNVTPQPFNVTEGAYSLHPELRGAYDMGVFLRVSPQEQSRRIRARNGESMLRRFRDEWIPMEETYFAAASVEDACEICFDERGEIK